MICDALCPDGIYRCSLPDDHIAHYSYGIHVAVEGLAYGSERCGCPECIDNWLRDQIWIIDWEDHETGGLATEEIRGAANRTTFPKIQNPPDVRTAKAGRLP